MRTIAVISMAVAMLGAVAMTGCVSLAPKATTQITSEPSGASIALDGKPLGTTPLTASIQIKPRYNGPAAFSGTARNMREAMQQIERQKQMANYVFVARKDGYQDVRKELFVNDGLPPEIRFELQLMAAPPQK